MSLVETILKKILGDPNEKVLKTYQSRIDAINALESEIEALSDDELKAKTPAFKKRLETETLDDIAIEAFAVVREVAKRVLKMRHFDVQLLGGLVLHEGRIAEMKTGEGKTLMSTLPAYLNALSEKGVYIVTVNDYLAKRDSEWMGEVFTFLGLSVGLIQAGMEPEERIQAYAADITYGTNNEYGFDYLRDNLAWSEEQCCQTRRHYAIIDEVDSILIDEARTPLIISGPVQESTDKYRKVVSISKRLELDTHFSADEKHKNIVLTEAGIEKIETSLKIENIYSVQNMEIAHMAIQCLRAQHLFKKDVDYVIKDGEVVIVDEFTGRLMEGRRYSDGLHQAIEAFEGLHIKEESQTLASVTFQNYFRMFPKLAGMTGTALTEEAEFDSIYNLAVVAIPTNKPLVRHDLADVIYKSKKEKYTAIIKDIEAAYEKGQPTLVGTISIETSEHLSSLLKAKSIPHNVLNAKHHEKEAEIIAKAGQKSSITIATNMAGRGTDIVLGEGIADIGGLKVIGSERHESRRIDNQLRGRSGRQGDPGETRFYVALDDDLMRMFGSDRIAKIMETLGVPADTPIEHPLISRSIEKAQMKVEKYHFSIRKQILEYDDVLNKQRETIYQIRRRLLAKTGFESLAKETIDDLVEALISDYAVPGEALSDETREEILEKITNLCFIQDFKEQFSGKETLEEIEAKTKEMLNKFYQFRRSQYPPNVYDDLIAKRVLLMTLDRKWMDHLHNMDVLREGIGLRAWGQRNPLIEYKKEAFDLFQELLYTIYEEAWGVIFKAVLVEENNEKPLDMPKDVKRNDPCPCGSGKKYKKCCQT